MLRAVNNQKGDIRFFQGMAAMGYEPLSLSRLIDRNIVVEADSKLESLGIGRFICWDLEISETAVVKGNIECRNVIVYGRVIGSVVASGYVSLRKTGKIMGSLTCSELKVEEGAVLNYQMMYNKSLSSLGRPIE